MTKQIHWDGALSQEGLDIIKGEGGVIVCPTKVGYIIMTVNKAGLERKFDAKERKRNKPGVVLCGSMEELRELAQLTPEIDAFYQNIGMRTFCWVVSCLGNQRLMLSCRLMAMVVKS